MFDIKMMNCIYSFSGVTVGGLWACTGEDLSKSSGRDPLVHLRRDLSARLLRAAQDVSKYKFYLIIF